MAKAKTPAPDHAVYHVTTRRKVCAGFVAQNPNLVRNEVWLSLARFVHVVDIDCVGSENTMFPSKAIPVPKTKTVLGGIPITKELAMELGNVTFGLSTAIWKSAWIKSGFCFRDADTDLGFGLIAQKVELKGFMMCIQAYVLKQLLFIYSKRSERLAKGRLLKPTKLEQEEVLVFALVDILYKVSQDSKIVTVCLPQENAYFEEDGDISTDGVTERLHFFEFSQPNDTQAFINKHLPIFFDGSGPGCLLFLYSLVLCKGFSKLRSEMGAGEDQLLNHRANTSQALVNLLLTGRASPYTHNGTVYEGDDDETVEKMMKVGILERSEIGQLVWNFSDQYGSLISSRLKTPRLPIWVIKTSCHYGILFSPNRELIRDYHAERQFELYYYSSNRGQSQITILSIDTRETRCKEQREIPLLERLIMTKWNEAKISWNGTTPFV